MQRFLPLFGEVARKYRAPVGPDWRVDETYARIRGYWHYIYRAIDGCGQIVDAYVSPTRDMVAARRFFERAIASSGTMPCRVITDKAATYPPALAAAVPGVLHRTGRYRTNGIERDHGFLKERLRPMRGLKSVVSAAIFMRGHALMRNIRRFSGDLHARSRADAQHPPSVLSACRVSAATAGPCLGLEPARRGRIGRPGRRRPFGCQSATIAAPPPHSLAREPFSIPKIWI